MGRTIHIFFSGNVQGVWFRKTSKEFASDLGLSGWVKNLDDGRVEMVVQGSGVRIDKLMDQLNGHFEVSEVEINELQDQAKMVDFRIKR